MANSNQAELRKEAEQYLTQMQNKFRADSREWGRFSAEVPDKFLQLVKSGIKPSISRGSDSGYGGGGRTLSVSLNFETNMDAAKRYLEDLKTEIPDRAKAFHKVIESFDKKLEYFHQNGLDGDCFEKLVKHFVQWVDYAKDLHVQIRDAKITAELPEKHLKQKKNWLELADTRKLEEDAKRYGIPVEDVPKHRKYLEAKQKRVMAKTSAAMKAAIKLLRELNGYQDSAELIEEAEKDVKRLQEKEAEAERIRKEEEERRKREEAERKEAERKKKLYQEALQQMTSDDEKMVAKAAASLRSLGEYEEAPAKVKEAEARVAKIKEENEKKRIEEERKRKEEEERKRKEAEEKRRREEEERKRREEEERKRKEAEEERKRIKKAKMKKTLTITGVVAGLLVLAYLATLIVPMVLRASGKMLPEFSAEALTEAQSYAREAVDEYEIYSKSNDFKVARVMLTDDLKAQLKGKVNIDKWDVSSVKAAVVFYIGPKDETQTQSSDKKWEMKSNEPVMLELGEKWFPVLTLLDGEKKVVYQFYAADTTEAVADGEEQAETVDKLRVSLAQAVLEKENYASQYTKQLAGFDADVESKLAENPNYLYTMECWDDCNAKGRTMNNCYTYANLCRTVWTQEKRLNTLSTVAGANAWQVEQLLDYDEDLLKQKSETLHSLRSLRVQMENLKNRAAKDLTALLAKAEEMKEQEDYLLNEELLHTALANSNSTTYYTYLRQEHIYVTGLEAIDKGLAITDMAERRYVLDRNNIVVEGYSKYGNELTKYMQQVLVLEQFEERNAEALTNYETENAAAKEAGGANYEQSIDYIKVQLKYESMLNEHAELKAAVEKAKAAADKVKADTEEKVAQKDEAEEIRLTGIEIQKEKAALWEYMIKEEPLISEYDAQKGEWGLLHPDYPAYQNQHLK